MILTPLTKSRVMEKHEKNKLILLKLFKLYDHEKKQIIYIDSVIEYLRLVSRLNENLTLDVMFNILDKEEKGYVNQNDLNMFIEGINNFLNLNNYSTDLLENIERLDKEIKKYFSKTNRVSKEKFKKFYMKELVYLRDLIVETEEIIIKNGLNFANKRPSLLTDNFSLIKNEVNSLSSEYSIKNDSFILSDSKVEENKDITSNFIIRLAKGRKNNSINSQKESKCYQASSIDKIFSEKNDVKQIIKVKKLDELSYKQKEKEKKFVENISNLSPIKQNDDKIITFDKKSNIQPLTKLSDCSSNDILFEELLDYEKFNFVESIRLSTNLYDFKCDELVENIIPIKKELKVLTKKNFVNIFTNIILTKSCDHHLFKIKQGLNDLYEIVNEDDLSKIMVKLDEMLFTEAIGCVLMLTSGNEDMKILSIFHLVKIDETTFNKKEFSEIISGIIKLLLRKPEKMTYNSKIFAEEITNKFLSNMNENDVKTEVFGDEFKKWLNKEDYKNKLKIDANSKNFANNYDTSKSSLSIFIDSGIINDKLNNLEGIISKITNYLTSINEIYFLNHVNVLEAVDIFKRNSLLGILNKTQFIQCFKDIFKIVKSKINLNLKEVFNEIKKDMCSKLFSLIDNKNNFYSLAEMFTGFSILFNGTKEEKLLSIFEIFNKDNKGSIKYKDVYSFFFNLLKFATNNIFKIEELQQISNAMTENIYQINGLKRTERIKYQMLLDYYQDIF